MTQRERVLKMLRDAGPRGVRSDAFYREFLGRGVARIYDLRQDGYEISSEKEGKYKRYFLTESVGIGADTRGDGHGGSVERSHAGVSSFTSAPPVSADSGEPIALFEDSTPSAYNPFSEAA